MADKDRPDPPPEVTEYFRQFGKYGSLGGNATKKKLKPAQRKANAKKASNASVKTRMKWSATKRKEQARAAARARWDEARKIGDANEP